MNALFISSAFPWNFCSAVSHYVFQSLSLSGKLLFDGRDWYFLFFRFQSIFCCRTYFAGYLLQFLFVLWSLRTQSFNLGTHCPSSACLWNFLFRGCLLTCLRRFEYLHFVECPCEASGSPCFCPHLSNPVSGGVSKLFLLGFGFSLGLFFPHPSNPVSWGVRKLFFFWGVDFSLACLASGGNLHPFGSCQVLDESGFLPLCSRRQYVFVHRIFCARL